MGRINFGRMIVGGLLAGLVVNASEFVLNIGLLAEPMNEAMKALNRPPIDNQMIVWFVVMGFLLGIGMVWLYAAIRPRFGPGVRTAVIAGVALWVFAYLYPNVFIAITGVFPVNLMLISTIWGLPEAVIATIAGAWAYTEM